MQLGQLQWVMVACGYIGTHTNLTRLASDIPSDEPGIVLASLVVAVAIAGMCHLYNSEQPRP